MQLRNLDQYTINKDVIVAVNEDLGLLTCGVAHQLSSMSIVCMLTYKAFGTNNLGVFLGLIGVSLVLWH